MSIKKMLVDATQAEELRVAVVNDERLEEFESETTTKVQNKGNIYLAKVVRIEPSLQAAFVDYGGERHGFLPFNEIHPDYYRIPVSDRKKFEEALKASQAHKELMDEAEVELEDQESEEDGPQNAEHEDANPEDAIIASLNEISDDSESEDSEPDSTGESPEGAEPNPDAQEASMAATDTEPAQEEQTFSTTSLHKQYKIQEVIKRRHIMLVQIVKEERGNKGASLTTYLSLPGRYCVLMPNAGHRSGGVSRKISDAKDRRRLRQVLTDLKLPQETGLIVRTAGAKRSKAEIKRDYEYLIKLWREIREKTLKSIAPSSIYTEGNLVHRAIRDIYDRDIEEVLVEGESGYKAAKNFMKSLTPSHAKRVKQYKSSEVSLFNKYKVEKQIDEMMLPTSPLPSGGSIVINPTEALVAIDVNSGRATRERHIEETAYKTNLEAADEVARQIRLRDLAGIIVIDFIDMNDNKRIKEVERRFRDAIQHDRARIQTSRISQFGLMELSRQRLRPSILESHSIACQNCQGTGVVRSVESIALGILRATEDDIIANKRQNVIVKVPARISDFLLNQKRKELVELETNLSCSIQVVIDPKLVEPDFEIESDKAAPAQTSDKKTSARKPKTAEPPKQKAEKQPAKDKSSSRKRRGNSKKTAAKPQANEAVDEKTPEDKPKINSDNVTTTSESKVEQKQEKSSRSRSSRRRKRSGRRSSGDSKSSDDQASSSHDNKYKSQATEAISEPAPSAANQPDLRIVSTPKGGAKPASTKAPVTTKTPDLSGDDDKQGKKGWWQRLLES